MAGDWIAVDVAELLDALPLTVDVEVVVAWLPDVVLRSGAGEALFEHLDGDGEFCGLRFG